MTQQTNTSTPTTVEPSSGFTDFILHRFHVAALPAKIVANKIETTATALGIGLISPETPLLDLRALGLRMLTSSSAIMR